MRKTLSSNGAERSRQIPPTAFRRAPPSWNENCPPRLAQHADGTLAQTQMRSERCRKQLERPVSSRHKVPIAEARGQCPINRSISSRENKVTVIPCLPEPEVKFNVLSDPVQTPRTTADLKWYFVRTPDPELALNAPPFRSWMCGYTQATHWLPSSIESRSVVRIDRIVISKLGNLAAKA